MNKITFWVLSPKDALHRSSSLRSGRVDGASPSVPPTRTLFTMTSSNYSGTALIEILFLLPLFILFISLLEAISEGYGVRIQNRLLSRYVSTYSFRENVTPSPFHLKEKFSLKYSFTIQNFQTTQIIFHPFWQKNRLTLTQHFFLWRKNHDSLFETTSESDEEEEF